MLCEKTDVHLNIFLNYDDIHLVYFEHVYRFIAFINYNKWAHMTLKLGIMLKLENISNNPWEDIQLSLIQGCHIVTKSQEIRKSQEKIRKKTRVRKRQVKIWFFKKVRKSQKILQNF